MIRRLYDILCTIPKRRLLHHATKLDVHPDIPLRRVQRGPVDTSRIACCFARTVILS